jgi:hypothetical protein
MHFENCTPFIQEKIKDLNINSNEENLISIRLKIIELTNRKKNIYVNDMF